MLCPEIAWFFEVVPWRKALVFPLVKCSFSLKYKCFRRLILIEFRLQLRHPLSLRCPIWQILLLQISWFSLKHACFTRASLTDSCEPFLKITSFLSQFKFEIEAAFTIWDSAQTGGSREREICKRNSKMLWKNGSTERCGKRRARGDYSMKGPCVLLFMYYVLYHIYFFCRHPTFCISNFFY